MAGGRGRGRRDTVLLVGWGGEDDAFNPLTQVPPASNVCEPQSARRVLEQPDLVVVA